MTETLPGAPAGLNELPPSSSQHAESRCESAPHQRTVEQYAYKLWEDAGRPEGDAERDRFWREAEQQLSHDTECSKDTNNKRQ